MNEEAVRNMILDRLHREYLKDSTNSVMKQQLYEAQGNLGTAPNVLDRNLRYLEEKGLVDVRHFIGGNFMVRLNAFGVDAVERHASDRHVQISARVAGPATILGEELDELLAEHLPVMKDELAITRNLLARGDKQFDFQSVALACRNHFLDFADTIYQPAFLPEGEVPPSRNQAKRKVTLGLRAMRAKETDRDFVEATISQFDALVDFIQKTVHEKHVIRAHAAACLSGLELVMLVALRELARDDKPMAP